MLIVSACLAGINCKYNGGSSTNLKVRELVSRGEAIPVCPEQLGGCPTPRPAAEIFNSTGADVLDGTGKIKRINGEDAAPEFIKGAEEVLNIARLAGCSKAILKSKSPSCGCGNIYDGTFSGKLVPGNGVTAELLLRNGIEVLTENDI
ncbi:MAG: DUF523 domain-containing protein [Bacillota bacterium]|nr:DUF523 domain-containing protein [Bacillota bacterium]